MTSEQQRTALEIESAKGDKYQRLYDDVLESFFEEKDKVLFDAFRSVPVTSTDDLVAIRMQSTALESLRSEFLTVIESGRLARMQLNEEGE